MQLTSQILVVYTYQEKKQSKGEEAGGQGHSDAFAFPSCSTIDHASSG